MQALAAPELAEARLLEVWERGLSETPAERALTLLSAAYPGTSRAALADLSVGQRDAALLRLREALFGEELTGLVTCPACGASLELAFRAVDLLVSAPAPGDAPLALAHAGYAIHFRLPTAGDLRAVEALGPEADLATAREVVLARCYAGGTHRDEPVPFEALPDAVRQGMVAAMAEADAQADVQLALTCPTCDHAWHVAFDVVPFLWQELHAWALRTLREVHALASAYGWSERDILAMHPWRRQVYLEMVAT